MHTHDAKPSSTLGGITHVRVFAAPAKWDATVRFYAETAGFTLIERDEEAGWAIFDLGQPPLLGVERDVPDSGEGPFAGRFAGVSFGVEDIHAAHRRLEALGVAFTGLPERQSWGGWLAHFTDPAGNVLTLAAYD